MNRISLRPALVGLCLLWSAIETRAETPVDFNRDIRPLMSNSCLICHGPDEAERAAGLRLDTEEGGREDLGGYAAIVPGDPDSSELIARLTTDDEDLKMPPEGKGRRLTEDEIELVSRWIRQGAPYANHWSYEKPTRPALPAVKQSDWPRNAIDYFVLAKLESAGWKPSPEAGRLVLARRVALDLTGLPPTWEEAMALVHDDREDAYERYVDRLLDSPAFGERWARVWLDLARYADSAGYADDPARTIWAYRDYVIRSLNDNKPFDQFTIEQIAGDLLPDGGEEALVATAFHRNTLTNNEGGTNNEEFRNVAVVDRVNTTMAVWMGTTMACAQCHTHKYDPITQEEYFRFFAFFNSTQDADERDERPTIALWSESQRQQRAEMESRIEQLKSVLSKSTPEIVAEQERWAADLQTPPAWQTLVPAEANAEHRSLKIEDDGWVQAEGEKSPRDHYTLQVATDEGELAGLRLEISDRQSSNFVLTKVDATWTPTGAEGIEARYVRVELPGKGKFLHVAEIEAFAGGRNLAIEGRATQSSTGFGGEAKYANDGITEGDFQKHKTTHTASEDNPWLEIDLGRTQPIEQLVVWNRSDGGESIRNRLKGYRLQLLDQQREPVWERSPEGSPADSAEFAIGGAIPLRFVAAQADHSQQGFSASSVLSKVPDPKKGWAIAGAVGKPHELTLLMAKPKSLGPGLLTVHLDQGSEHQRHLLDRFRLSLTEDPRAASWASLPAAVRKALQVAPEQRDDAQNRRIAEYYRSISPRLKTPREELKGLQKKLAALKPHTTVPVMRQLPDDKRRVTRVQIRGNYLSTGDEVDEGTPAAFHPMPENAKPDRLALARWLVDDENPLTARVIANRHWEQIFGIGIVETSEEFGSQGELPSHPLLLDWMAVELRDNGWDLKALLKLIVTSASYRQSSVATDELISRDPQNRMIGRGPRFRISAEMVRDQALFVSGLLSDKMYGPPVKPPQPELGLKAAFGSATDWKTSSGNDKYRRGIYTTWRRSSPYPSMAQFDAPNREVCTVRRIRTNTPLQALVTLNDPVYVEAAQALGRLMMASSETPEERIAFGFRNALLREPNPSETGRLLRLVETVQSHFATQNEMAVKMATDPIGALPEGIAADEAAAWSVVGNVILNLDEMYMKR